MIEAKLKMMLVLHKLKGGMFNLLTTFSYSLMKVKTSNEIWIEMIHMNAVS